MANIECLDYEDQSRKSYYGPTYNKIHHIVGPVTDLCTGKELPNRNYEIQKYVRRNNLKNVYEIIINFHSKIKNIGKNGLDGTKIKM